MKPDESKDAAQTVTPIVLITSAEMQALYERLCHRNFIRRELGVRLMDITTVFRRKVALMTEDRYNQLLEPILVEMFGEAEWPNGFTPRLLLAVRLHKLAVDQLQAETGIADPRTKKPDILALIDKHGRQMQPNVILLVSQS